MSWGGSWGSGWGGGGSGLSSFFVEGAYATSSRTFNVVFSTRPQVQSPINLADASNVKNLILTNLTTGAVTPLFGAAATSDVLVVAYVMSAGFEFAPDGYRVACSNIAGYLGETLVDPKIADFSPLVATQVPVQLRRPLIDLLNPQTSGEQINGGLVHGADGDYLKEGDVQLLKKLIIRRIITAVGEFYHLAGTNYGFGLSVKATVVPSDLVALRTALQLAVATEPGVSRVSVGLELAPSGVLTISVNALLQKTNQPITLSIPIFPQG